MIKISNGIRETTVTKGAYKSIFKPQGWSIAGKNDDLKPENKETYKSPYESMKNDSQERIELSTDIYDDLDEEFDDDIETPLSEMSVKELHAYAAENGIDVSKAKNKAEIIKIIEAIKES